MPSSTTIIVSYQWSQPWNHQQLYWWQFLGYNFVEPLVRSQVSLALSSHPTILLFTETTMSSLFLPQLRASYATRWRRMEGKVKRPSRDFQASRAFPVRLKVVLIHCHKCSKKRFMCACINACGLKTHRKEGIRPVHADRAIMSPLCGICGLCGHIMRIDA